MAGKIENRLTELGIELPEAPAPAANYVPFTMHNGMLIISGQISKQGDGTMLTGKLGDSVDVAGGQAAARVCALAILAQAKAALGDLDRITQVLKLQGFVNATPDFKDHRLPIGCAKCCVLPPTGWWNDPLLIAVCTTFRRTARKTVGAHLKRQLTLATLSNATFRYAPRANRLCFMINRSIA